MHNHDLDLIAAFAEGDDPDGIAAGLIEQCQICAAEYRNQQAVTAALRSIPRIRLDDRERDKLRAGVSVALGATVTPLNRRWVRVGSVAAAILVVGSVGSLLGGGGDTTATTEFTTIAAALGGAESSNFDAAAPTSAASLTAESGRLTTAYGTVTNLGVMTRDGFVAALEAEVVDDQSMKSMNDTSPTPLPCSDSVSGAIQRTVVAEVDGVAVIGYVVGTDVGISRLAFRLTDCTSYALD